MLSLFDTDSEDESLDGADTSPSEDDFVVKHIPMNEAISTVPASYAELLEVLLPRFQPHYNLKGISIEDQESLAKILIGELASQFSVIHRQIDDPFLSPSSNKELHRLTFVEVSTILEALFRSYLAKACRLNSEDTIHVSAQISCLHAELIIVANKRINIPFIRRKIIARLQKGVPSAYQATDTKDQLSHGVDDLDEVYKVQLNYPLSLQNLATDHSASPQNCTTNDSKTYYSDEEDLNSTETNEIEPLDHVHSFSTFNKVPSEPTLPTDALLYDLGMQNYTGKGKKQFLGLWDSPSLNTLKGLQVFPEKKCLRQVKTSLGDYTDEMLRNDVKTLSLQEMVMLEQGNTSGDLSPLLAARTFTSFVKKQQPLGLEAEPVTAVLPVKQTPAQSPLHQIPLKYSLNSSFNNTGTDYSEINTPFDSSLHESLNSDGIKISLSHRSLSDGSNDTLDLTNKSQSSKCGNDESCISDVELLKDTTCIKQPDVLAMALPQNDIGRASNVRVSERSPVFSLRLQSQPAVYNELTNDLDIVTLEQLDSNLKEGHDIYEIYEELSQTLPKEHLAFDKDPVLEPFISDKITMSTVYASSTLHHRKSTRIVNESLVHAGFPPWKGKSRKEWLSSQQEKVTWTSKSQKKNSKVVDTVSVNDYFKFAANRGSDYLGVIHHMYDSSGSDSEDEQKEEEKKRKLRELQQNLLMKEKNRFELLRQKNLYTPGKWNVNAVLMGGLGNDPEVLLKEQGPPVANWSVVQARLKNIWIRLQLSDDDQFDMAFKLSRPKFHSYIDKTLNLWENCCEVIEKREMALKQLESFEAHASDPTRHFCRSSSLLRLREARQRATLHKDIDAFDREVVKFATQLSKYNFTLKYRERDYVEKMRLDRVELLYFLHQQRRQAVIHPALKVLNNSVDVPTTCST